MKKRPSLQLLLQSQIQDLATTLQPSTISGYRSTVGRFLRFLKTAYPAVDNPSQLRRDPHILGFLQSLHQQRPPLKNGTRSHCLIKLRRLLDDLARNKHCTPELLTGDDLPPLDIYLPKPLSPDDDQRLADYLHAQDDLLSNALLLLRATGMRIGEASHLSVDCLHRLNAQQWALKVPLGKLHTERWIPVDDQARQIIARLLALRPPDHPSPFLLLKTTGQRPHHDCIGRRLAKAALQAGCSAHLTPHQLRHSYATEMIRAGVSLPAVMQLLGHKSIRMTMRYVLITPNDMHQQYHHARRILASKHLLPSVPTAQATPMTGSGGILALRNSLAAALHLLANYRLGFSELATRRKLARLSNRLVKISAELARL